jgi:hypothetical protein
MRRRKIALFENTKGDMELKIEGGIHANVLKEDGIVICE